MGSDIQVRHEVRGVLRCVSAVHVGGWDASFDADLALARDGLDEVILPGTAIAGALRNYLARLHDPATGGDTYDEPALNALFGFAEPGTQHGAASRIYVEDAQLIDPVRPVLRDGVGIDRRTGSAARGFLYQREVLPAGTRFAFHLVGEATSGRDPVSSAVEALTAALRAGRVPIGAGSTRGLGAIVLEQARTRAVPVGTRDGLQQPGRRVVRQRRQPEDPPGRAPRSAAYPGLLRHPSHSRRGDRHPAQRPPHTTHTHQCGRWHRRVPRWRGI
jgi:CRISPR/Cas system CSM-associated protein Csm3 (group 7 of RAMP superfamily)